MLDKRESQRSKKHAVGDKKKKVWPVPLPKLFKPKSTNTVQITHGERSKEYCFVQTSHITCIEFSRNPLKDYLTCGVQGSRKTQTITTSTKKRLKKKLLKNLQVGVL